MFNRVKNLLPYIKKVILWYFLKRKLRKEIEPSEWGIVCPYGIGDTYFVCALATELMHKHGGKSIKFFVKPSHQSIPGLFGFRKTIPVENLKSAEVEKKCRLQIGTVIVGHPVGFGLYKDTLNIGKNGLLLIDLYKKMFALPKDTRLSKPSVSRSQIKKAKAILKSHSYVPGRTVILAPDAVSTAMLKNETWKGLADVLSKNGYKVFFNKIGSEKFLGYDCLNFNLSEAIPVCELAGNVISIRSGFCDLVSSANTNLIVLYPDGKWLGGTIYDGSSLKKMGLSAKVNELVFKENNIESVYKQILNLLY